MMTMALTYFYYFLGCVLLYTGITSFLQRGIPRGVREKLDNRQLRIWSTFRGIGCLLGFPVFILTGYSQHHLLPAEVAWVMGTLILIALACVMIPNKILLGKVFAGASKKQTKRSDTK